MKSLALSAALSLAAATVEAATPSSGFLGQYAATRGFQAGVPTSQVVTPSGDAVLFLRSGPRNFVQDLYELDLGKRRERVLLTAGQILRGAEEHLPAVERARRERARQSARGITSYRLAQDGRRLLVPLEGRLFVIERASGAVRELQGSPGFPVDPQFSSDGSKVACVRNGDLYVLDVEDGREQRLTSGANDTLAHGLAEFIAQEEMDRFRGYWWSPDGGTIAYQETNTAGVERLHILDPAHPEQSAESWPYPRAGGRNADVRLGLISAAGGPTTWVGWDRARFPYLAAAVWARNAPLTLLVQNRRQTEERLLAVDPQTGRTSRLLAETDPAWLNLDPTTPRWLSDGSAFLWSSEREGAWQLELRSRRGQRLRRLTPLGLGYRGLVGLDEKRGVAWVRAGGEPTETHLYRIPLDPARGGPERVTREPGLHGAVFASGGFGETYLHGLSALSGEQRQTVCRADGREVGELTSLAEKPTIEPRLELVTLRKSLGMRALLVRPRDFDRARRYPVVVSVYGGPRSQTVQASRRSQLLKQWIADHGFVVVSIDGRGTPARGRAWERAIHGDLIAVPLADQVAGLRELGSRYPELDLGRVGIYGWSFGGYFAAMAVMRHPEVFRAAVAGAPVADWRDYDTHYTERYMGLPQANLAGYRSASVLTYADRLERPLLVIHGTDDDNVYFLHSIKLCDALFRAGKSFEFLPLTGFTHMVADPLVTVRLYERIVEFFEQNLAARP
ncbi:MAG TPA: DPP IV N-terminal domain-containing protein [Candidatus Eisenbacteria bacterium]|jgi:dipeptidyl-peptidase-4